MSEKRKNEEIICKKIKKCKNDFIITTILKNGKWEKMDFKNNINNKKVLEEKEEIIQNNEAIKNLKNNKYEGQYYNKDNLVEITNLKFKQLNNNDKDAINNIKIKIPNKKNEYGNIIEERRNYILYVSGIGNKNNEILEENKIIKDINHKKDDNLIDLDLNYTKISDCSFSKDRNYSNYIYYSRPTKRTYMSPYNLKNKGILRDNLLGKIYKVYHAIPIQLDNLKKINNKLNENILYRNNKNNYTNYNIKSKNYIKNNDNVVNYKKKFIFQKPINGKEKNNFKLNRIKNNEIINPDLEKIKSLYVKKKSYSPNCKGNIFIYKKENNKRKINNNIKS